MPTRVFVYGTLRPGQINYSLLQHAVTVDVAAQLDDHVLKADVNAAFPYGTPLAGARIIGTLLQLHPKSVGHVLNVLDMLEGYRVDRPAASHYLRTRCIVTTLADSSYGPAGSTVEAWVYLAGPGIDLDHTVLVDGGDWTTRLPGTPNTAAPATAGQVTVTGGWS